MILLPNLKAGRVGEPELCDYQSYGAGPYRSAAAVAKGMRA